MAAERPQRVRRADARLRPHGIRRGPRSLHRREKDRLECAHPDRDPDRRAVRARGGLASGLLKRRRSSTPAAHAAMPAWTAAVCAATTRHGSRQGAGTPTNDPQWTYQQVFPGSIAKTDVRAVQGHQPGITGAERVCVSFNGRFRDELMACVQFNALLELVRCLSFGLSLV